MLRKDGKELIPIEWTRLMNIKSLVIFIGPSDSPYNSIAWFFSAYNLSRKGRKSSDLVIPEKGRIEAISSVSEGRKEILSRIHYEFLHDSVVTQHGLQFRVPEKAMLEKILNIGATDRSYTCRLEPNTNTRNGIPDNGLDPDPLFRESNLIRFNQCDPKQIKGQLPSSPLPIHVSADFRKQYIDIHSIQRVSSGERKD